MAAVTDERLMAYADGELPPEEAAALERALRADGELRRRLALFQETRTAMNAAFTPVDEVPPALRARVADMVAGAQSATVTPLRPRRAAPWRGVPLQLAASVAAVLAAGAIGYMVGTGSEQAIEGGGGLLAMEAGGEVAAALDTLPSGQELAIDGDTRLRVVSSFMLPGEVLCREVEFDRAQGGTISVLCRTGDAWRTRLAIAVPASGTEGYRPASAVPVIDAFLDDMAAGPALGPEEEAEQLRAR